MPSSRSRASRTLATRSRSRSHRCFRSASRRSVSALRSARCANRSAWSVPVARSRSSTRVCTAISSNCRVASSSAAGIVFWPRASRAHAVSSTLTALSGSWRSGRYRWDSRTAASAPSSRIRTLWCFSSAGTTPRIITIHTGSEGSSTLTSWKRRASAGSFSKYFLYSDHVVAAIVRSSPRASAGLSRFAASLCPAAPPAPIMVCASSMKRMIGVGELFTSSISPRSRFSNSPFTPAPAWRSARSRVRRVTPRNTGGTSPWTMRMAKPSTTAVLPTPASPTSIGLFCRRRVRISTT